MQYISTLLEILMSNYFIESRCIFFFTGSLNTITPILSIPIVYLNNELLPEKLFQNYGCRDIIIDYENSQEIFQKFEYLIRFQSERFNTRRYIILWENNTENSVHKFFQLDEFKHVCDVLLITKQEDTNNHQCINDKCNIFNRMPDKNEIYQFFTHQFGSNNKSTKILLLDKWFSRNSSFLLNNHLFPNKLTNLLGRNLVIATMNYAPYSVINRHKSILDGIETRLIFEFFKKYNLTAEFLQVKDFNWGNVYPNWTGDGVLGNVAMGYADIGLAGIFRWEKIYNYLDFSVPLLRVGMTVIAPAPKPAAGWSIPVLSFCIHTWVALALVFIVCTIILFLTLIIQNYGNLTTKFVYSLTTLTRVYLLQPINIISQQKAFKYVLGLMLIKILVISSSYSSGLASIMTIQRFEHGIATLQDLADSNLEWGNADKSFIFAINEANYSLYKKIKSTFSVHSKNELARISKTYNYAFTVERLPFGHICVGEFIKKDIIHGYRLMQDDIYWDETIFVLRKHSVLSLLLDDLIFKICESGLVAYWESQVVALHMDPVVQRVLRYYNRRHKDNHQQIVKLKWQHVQGPFGILSAGLVIASVCFIGEWIIYKRNRRISNNLNNKKVSNNKTIL